MAGHELTQLGVNLGRLRLAKGMTQKQLSKKSGVTSIAMIECGLRTQPRLATLMRITKALGVTLEDLYRNEPKRATKRRVG
jgi:transcriptional regulator with XRE-family HTH domain